MSLLEMLGAVLIGPLKLLFEVIFSTVYSMLKNPGLTVVVLSLAVNIFLLPLYRRADAIQIEARDTENKLKDVVAHIKKTFTGDERMMILQTYYRQNNYSPLSVLSGSVSLLLEIPFFIAAYQFLSGISAFDGAAFGPIQNLGEPDGMIAIGNIRINALPILMTVINVVSSSLYLKDFPLKTKIQLYGMALVFLILLYNSPAALVLYWTLNNLFSLVKTLYPRIRHSRKILGAVLCLAGLWLIGLSVVTEGHWRSAWMLMLGLACQLPWAMPIIAKKLPPAKGEVLPQKGLFVAGGVFLTVLVGLLIPSAYIAESPQEYISATFFYHPIWYMVKTLCISAGTFVLWFGVFYWLAKPKGKVLLTRILWILCGAMLVNYMFFGRNLGIISPDLQYAEGISFARAEQVRNLAVLAVLAAGMWFVSVKFPKKLTAVLLVGAIAVFGMGALNTAKIAKTVSQTKDQLRSTSEDLPTFNISKEGKNVVVIMLDRGVGPFVPYIMEENPKIREQFDGFTYYENTMSYAAYTNLAAPALYGGYDYTPVNINLRSDELLADKHNEALKVVPAILSEAGFEVTVLDPSYAGYQWIPDLSIYDGMEGVTADLASGKFTSKENQAMVVETRSRNFFLFSLMKTLPLPMQSALYNEGGYHAAPVKGVSGVSLASFMNSYNVLAGMADVTNVTEGAANTYMFLRSNVTHEPIVLQEPDFTPVESVDNSDYYPAEGKTITAGDSSYLLESDYKISHYHVNMAALIQLGNWFDYLRENDVYDNTRIIVVADHGWELTIFEDGTYREGDYMYEIMSFAPMLLVKDFNAEGFTTSGEFMTNADVPALSLADLVESPVNPFTGNPIDTSGKEGVQHIILSKKWKTEENNGYQFIDSEWASVSENIWDLKNWEFNLEESTFPP